MAKFVVDRRTWYRGFGRDESMLLREDGKRCCIGFVAKQCGVADAYIENIGAISVLNPEDRAKFPIWMKTTSKMQNGTLQEAYIINDDKYMDDVEREQRLKALFAKYGDEIVFEN